LIEKYINITTHFQNHGCNGKNEILLYGKGNTSTGHLFVRGEEAARDEQAY
jgi:hypothetical protein